MSEHTVTEKDISPRQDPREVYQERAKGTVDLDGGGEASFTVDLEGEMEAGGLGLFGTADSGDGEAALSALTPDSVDVDITGGTADASGVEWELVVSEDGFFRDSGADLDGGE